MLLNDIYFFVRLSMFDMFSLWLFGMSLRLQDITSVQWIWAMIRVTYGCLSKSIKKKCVGKRNWRCQNAWLCMNKPKHISWYFFSSVYVLELFFCLFGLLVIASKGRKYLILFYRTNTDSDYSLKLSIWVTYFNSVFQSFCGII